MTQDGCVQQSAAGIAYGSRLGRAGGPAAVSESPLGTSGTSAAAKQQPQRGVGWWVGWVAGCSIQPLDLSAETPEATGRSWGGVLMSHSRTSWGKWAVGQWLGHS